MFENLTLKTLEQANAGSNHYWVRNTLTLEKEYLNKIGELVIHEEAEVAVLRNFDNTKLTIEVGKYLDLNITESEVTEIEFPRHNGYLHLNYGTDLANLPYLKNNDQIFINYTQRNNPRLCPSCGEILTLSEGQVHICVCAKYDSLGEAQMHKDMSLFVCKPLSP